jgi:hypothetical protein
LNRRDADSRREDAVGLLITIIGVAVLLIIGGVIIGYLVSRSEETPSHYKHEKEYEARVKKGIREDKMKKARKRRGW